MTEPDDLAAFEGGMSEPPPSRKMATRFMGGRMVRLARLQVEHPVAVLLVVLAVSLVFGWRASLLELRTRYDQLLPDSQPSVVELRRLEKRANNAQVAFVLLEGDDPRTLREFGDAVVVALKGLGPSVVTSVEDGVQAATRFLEPRAGLFLDLTDIQSMKSDVDARWDWEVSRAVGSSLDDDDNAPPPINREQFEKRFLAKADAKTGHHGVDRDMAGYYQRKDGKALVVVAGSPAPAGDLSAQQADLDAMRGAVDKVQGSRSAWGKVRVSWAGALLSSIVEYGAVKTDLLRVGSLGIALVLAALVLYFMRLRALIVMGVTIACGLAWTFGLTELAIGHLNMATGFLFSIILGNGINVGVIYVARYYEEKRRGLRTAEAVRTAHLTTWPSTLVAAIAAAAAYSSLAVTDFRAFRQFAFVGATGMLLCWVVTVTLLPTLLLLLDREPMRLPSGNPGFLTRLRYQGVPYGRLFAEIVPKIPVPLVGLGVIVIAVGLVTGVRYVREDPMEYDLAKIQNDKSDQAELHRTFDVVGDILGQFPNAMIVLANSPQEAKDFQRVEEKRWASTPEADKPFQAVHSIFDFIPDDQEKKLEVLRPLADRLRRAHDRKFMTEEDWEKIRPFLPPVDLKPFGIQDLPDEAARPFTEKDGTRGTLVLVEPRADQNIDDLHYLIRYADSFRETKLEDGKVLYGSGRATIFADILGAVVREIPRSMSLSLIMTLIAVFVTFRRGSHSASVLAALLVGLAGVVGFMYFARVRVNLLNFVALPVTFGIGVDYAVNVMQRYHADGSRDILGALRTTGGAVVLCSLTTMLGYFALVGSHNEGIRSLGEVAVVGEISCLLTAVLVLPSFWLLIQRRGRNAASPLSTPRLPRVD